MSLQRILKAALNKSSSLFCKKIVFVVLESNNLLSPFKLGTTTPSVVLGCAIKNFRSGLACYEGRFRRRIVGRTKVLPCQIGGNWNLFNQRLSNATMLFSLGTLILQLEASNTLPIMATCSLWFRGRPILRTCHPCPRVKGSARGCNWHGCFVIHCEIHLHVWCLRVWCPYRTETFAFVGGKHKAKFERFATKDRASVWSLCWQKSPLCVLGRGYSQSVMHVSVRRTNPPFETQRK